MLLAFDTETTLIPDRPKIRSRSGAEIATGPFVVPDLVLGSVARGPETWLETPEGLADGLECKLRAGWELVGHNLVFDILVVCKRFPHLRPLFDIAAEEGRLHDTMYLDLLVGLAQGRYDRPIFDPAVRSWSVPDVRTRSLDTLAREYCGIVLDKDPAVRLSYGQFLGRPLAELPVAHRRYAEDDARATLAVYQALCRKVSEVRGRHNLSEGLQVRAALALSALDSRGVCVDRALAGRLAAEFEAQLQPLKERLVTAGLGRWKPRPKTRKTVKCCGLYCPADLYDWKLVDGKLERRRNLKTVGRWDFAEADFSLNTAAIQAAVAAHEDPDDPAPRRADGTISLNADHWEGACLPKEAGDLHDWLLHEKVKKILATYLSVYTQTERVYPQWHVVGARSGRMAASRPNLQNIPKRKAGIRALFVPAPGRVFVVADYSAQEMFTLCESMLSMGIIGPLYKALTSGEDFHRLGAGLVLGKDPKDVTKEERQAQKALHFGVPGGLGAKKLAAYAWSGYGVDWSVEEAGQRRQRFLDAYTDVAEFLRRLKTPQDTALRAATGEGQDYWREKVGGGWNVIKTMCCSTDPAIAGAGLDAERRLTVELGSGRQRGGCRFTEGANTYFQGPASDVTKTAVWKAYRAGLCVVMVVHDEIVIETNFPEAAGRILEKCMKDAFVEVCPRMGPYAGVEVKFPLTKWGPATTLEGKEFDV